MISPMYQKKGKQRVDETTFSNTILPDYYGEVAQRLEQRPYKPLANRIRRVQLPLSLLKEKTMEFLSETYGKVNIKDVPEKIADYVKRMEHFESPFQITVGTDSQNFSDTKIVSVIAVICEGHGGIFFYDVSRIRRIADVRLKLTEETTRSLEIMTTLVSILEEDRFSDIRGKLSLAIHVDAGWSDKGKTKELIPGLIGWIKACGFDAKVKPESYTASSIADKISK